MSTNNISRLDVVSRRYTGTTTLPLNRNRSYFFVVMEGDSTGTVQFGRGGGLIPLGVGFHFEPSVCPTSEIQVVSTGSYIIVEG